MSMHKQTKSPELRQALINHHLPVDAPSQIADTFCAGWQAAQAAQPVQPTPPSECKTEAEKTAFAFGWWKALETAQPVQPSQARESKELQNLRSAAENLFGSKLEMVVYPASPRPVQTSRDHRGEIIDVLCDDVFGETYESPQTVQPSQAVDGQDAARYRWFADIAVSGDFERAEKAFSVFEHSESCTKQEVDAAIDAAINAKEQSNG